MHGLLFVLFEAIVFGLDVTIVPQLVGAPGTWAVPVAWLLIGNRAGQDPALPIGAAALPFGSIDAASASV